MNSPVEPVAHKPRTLPRQDFLRLQAAQARCAETRRAYEDAQTLLHVTAELMRERYGIGEGEAVGLAAGEAEPETA